MRAFDLLDVEANTTRLERRESSEHALRLGKSGTGEDGNNIERDPGVTKRSDPREGRVERALAGACATVCVVNVARTVDADANCYCMLLDHLKPTRAD